MWLRTLINVDKSQLVKQTKEKEIKEPLMVQTRALDRDLGIVILLVSDVLFQPSSALPGGMEVRVISNH